jgi:hypothetical protein
LLLPLCLKDPLKKGSKSHGRKVFGCKEGGRKKRRKRFLLKYWKRDKRLLNKPKTKGWVLKKAFST